MPRNNELLKSCLSASTLNPGLQRAERHDGHSHDQPAPARFELPLGFYHENSQWGLTSMALHGKERFGAGAKTFRVHVWKPRSWALEKRRFGSQFWSREGGQTAALSDMMACLQVLSNLWRTNRMPIRIKAQTGRCAGSTWWPNLFGVVMPTSIGSFLSRHVFRPRTRFQLEVRHGQLRI